MSLANLLAKIAADTDERARQFLTEAESAASRQREEAESDAKEAAEKSWQKALEQRQELLRKTQSKLALAARKKILARQKELVGEAFTSAEEELAARSGKELIAELAKKLAAIPEKEGRLAVPAGRKKEVEEAARAAGKEFSVAEDGALKVGFFFYGGSFEVDGSARNSLAALRQEIEGKVLARLIA